MDQLIKIQATGTPINFAKRLKIVKSTLYEYLKTMKENGAPIKYCRIRQSYYYDFEGRFIVEFI